MEGVCAERRPEVSATAADLERVVCQAGELMDALVMRLDAVLSPDAPAPVNPETNKMIEPQFSAPLAQHLDGLKTRMNTTIELGENLLRRIKV